MSACHEENQKTPATAGLPVIALAGNPNCGKTTLFNLLTGAHQHVGNWPGVTVERRSGSMNLDGHKISVADLPGVYSLLGRIDHSLLAQGSRALVPILEPMGIHQDNWPAISGLIAGATAKEIVTGTLNGIYQRQNAADLLADYRDPDIARNSGIR